MKVQQSFLIDQPRERVWSFFEDVPGVARCVPGVEDVEVLDADTSRVRLTQSVGPMSATFDLKMRVTERVQGERMEFTAIGKAVKGAAGNVRTVNVVSLSPEGEGTRVALDADMAMGGVLGSVGQKVIARQASGVTSEFAVALERALNGEAPADVPGDAPAGARAEPASPGTARATAPSASRPAASGDGERLPARQDPRVTGLAGLSLGLSVAVLVALRLGRR